MNAIEIVFFFGNLQMLFYRKTLLQIGDIVLAVFIVSKLYAINIIEWKFHTIWNMFTTIIGFINYVTVRSHEENIAQTEFCTKYEKITQKCSFGFWTIFRVIYIPCNLSVFRLIEVY